MSVLPPDSPHLVRPGLFPRAITAAEFGEAAANAGTLHLNALTNALLRLSRTTAANNSPEEICAIAENGIESLQAFVRALAANTPQLEEAR